jgi:CelD/BcsL family acetyltransferase involved in cellulose biosynthesis
MRSSFHGVGRGFGIAEAVSLQDLEQLRPEWEDLFHRCPTATPFQHPGWLISWWRHLGEGTLRVLALRTEERLIGLAPLFIHKPAATTESCVLFLGTGVTDYQDLLLEPGFEEDGTAAIVAFLEKPNREWDACDFQQLRPGSPLLNYPLLPEWRSEITVQEVCPVLTLAPDRELAAPQIPSHMRDKLRYYRRRAFREEGFTTETATHQTLEELFEAFLSLHRAPWASRRQASLIAGQALEAFHRDVAREFFKAGLLRLHAVRLKGRIASTLYAFHAHARTYHYRNGFDPAFASLSPGTLVIGHAIDQAFSENAKEFDFLRGRETYKYMWGARGRLNCRRVLRRVSSARTAAESRKSDAEPPELAPGPPGLRQPATAMNGAFAPAPPLSAANR